MAFYSHMLNDQVDLEPVDSLNGDGSKSYAAKKTGLAAYVRRSISDSGTAEGIEDDLGTEVWLEAEEVGRGDRITLPSGETMRVQRTETVTTTDGRLDIYKAQG